MPRKPVKTHLPAVSAPLEWATIADGTLYTAQIPLDNLRRTVEAAGGSMADVTQVLVFLPDASDFAGMNEIYAKAFQPPYPNRATIVANLMVPGARIELVAYAHIGGRSAAARGMLGRPKAADRKRAAPKRRPKRAGRRR
jgi:2-iminobutanoate/2-iminopropanoate deaminase